jgi:hypothetical protein
MLYISTNHEYGNVTYNIIMASRTYFLFSNIYLITGEEITC